MISALINTIFFLTFRTGYYHKTLPIDPETVSKPSQGSGYFFHDKMPGCCPPSLTAATPLQFTAGGLQRSLQQEPAPRFAFLGGNSLLPIRRTGAIILA
jgi:hypothetical protein